MKFSTVLGEDRKVVVPEEIVDKLRLEPGTPVEVEVQPREFDAERFKRVLAEYRGSMREQMLAAGYASVDELMNEIRPEW